MSARKRDRSDIDKMGAFDYGLVMPRTARIAPGGMVFHVLNRGVARMQLFEKPADYQAFEQVLGETLGEYPMRISAYTLMPKLRRSVRRGRPFGRLEWQKNRETVGSGIRLSADWSPTESARGPKRPVRVGWSGDRQPPDYQ